MTKRVTDAVIETLQAAAVKRCSGIAGDTLNWIAHAIDRGEIECVHMQHEEAGTFAAVPKLSSPISSRRRSVSAGVHGFEEPYFGDVARAMGLWAAQRLQPDADNRLTLRGRVRRGL
jgi:Thiamine pyrophosphate enzyme, N-terminal TPP binding domain